MNSWQKLFILAIVIILVKTALFSFIPTLSAYSDEYVYAKTAQSLYTDQTLTLHGQATAAYPPLYSLALAPAYFFTNMHVTYWVMQLINAILSTLIIFIAFQLARKHMSEHYALITAGIIGIIPATFAFTPYLLSENLFYLLLLGTIYALYQLFATEKWKYALYSGLLIGACILTKWSSIVLLSIPFFMLIWQTFLRRNLSQKTTLLVILTSAVAGIITSLWLIRNGLLFGFTLQGMLGNAIARNVESTLTNNNFIFSFISWIVLYHSYLLIGSGILFGILALHTLITNTNKNNRTGIFVRLSILVLLMFILVAANHSSSVSFNYDSPFDVVSYRPIGRYIEGFIPLLIILGMLAWNERKKIHPAALTAAVVLTALGTLLTIAPLIPANNPSTTWVGLFSLGLKNMLGINYYAFSWTIFLAVLGVLLIALYLAGKALNLQNRTLFTLLITFFLIGNALCSMVTNERSHEWNERDDIQFIKAHGYLIDGPVLFDEQSCTERIGIDSKTLCEGDYSTVSGFWTQENVRIGDPSSAGRMKYIISTRDLPYEIVAQGDELTLYKP